MKIGPVIERDFYLRDDVALIARELLGTILRTEQNGNLTSGIITETEAYAGVVDKASHAFAGRRTARTEVMYREGGISYVYLCYGIHKMFNVVTNKIDVPHAVLIRAVNPIEGNSTIESRRKVAVSSKDWMNGPGKVCQGLGINLDHNGNDLCVGEVRIYNPAKRIPFKIKSTPRIGVDYAEEDSHLPYRFVAQE